ncbi:MAC/Perforin domain-containing protein [Amylocystis lapponica]|nr:MAC/Perforin domain-containing protein [Amylocystis lapponica]
MTNELPATNWLGYSLDMTQTTPLDMKSVTQAVKKMRRILNYRPDEDTRPVQIGDLTYDVPRCIGVAMDAQSVQGNYITYKTGSEASSNFQADASLTVRYLAVSGGVSASYGTEKSFRQENQYAFYSFNSDTYTTSMQDYIDFLNETPLKNRIAELPKPFNGADADNLKQWRDFFASFGTHVIIHCSYGARFQLNVWASNSESSVNNRFSTSVTAAFNGIVAGGQFDASVKNEEQYKTFSEFMQRLVSIQGGDAKLAGSLGADPTQGDVYKEWAESTATYSELSNMYVVELWTLLREAASKDLRDAANTVESAYTYMTTHPQPYKTFVTLSIESDWAEFGLLTPSGVIAFDPSNPIPSQTVFTETRVQWGKEHSHAYERMDIRFMVINDGSPIDFYISHGSNGGQPGKGTAQIIMEQNQYVNDQITDNNWNTVYFYHKAVSPKAQTSTLVRRGGRNTWNTVLNAYLREIGVPSRLGEARGADAFSNFREVKDFLPSGKHLYRSSAPHYPGDDEIQHVDDSDLKFLQSKGITGIISFNSKPYDSASQALMKTYKIDYLHRPVGDFKPPTQADFAAANTFFLARTTTMLHCGAGYGRTGTGVTALQLYATRGKNPPQGDWKTVNDVEEDCQVAQLVVLRDSLIVGDAAIAPHTV